jgi:plastocyanin
VNDDSVNRALVIEPASEQGFFFNSVSAYILQPGDMVAFSLHETGEYKYYCSMNRQLSGKITVIK